MDKKRLYLIDATAFCYRAFYAVRGLSTSSGQPTGAVYGFVNILNKILKEQRPDYLAVCFDVSRETFRTKKFAEYKMQRPSMPDDLSAQIPIIKDILDAYGIAILEQEGYEADDIIATLARISADKGLRPVIVSSDKDMLQLVDKDIEVFNPYKEEGFFYTAKNVYERFGVAAGQITDVISLMGDSVDNIPGIPGIGEKTAVELIKEFGSLDNLLDNIEKIKKPKIKESIANNLKQIRLNKELVSLADKVNIDVDLDKLKIKEPDYAALAKIFRRLEFKKLLKGLEDKQPEAQDPEVKVDKLNLEKAGKIIGKGQELFLYANTSDNVVMFQKNKYFSIKDAPYLKSILADPKIRKVSHDLKRIKILLAKDGFELNGLFFDTMIASYLLNPSRGDYTLESVAFNYLEKITKDNLANPEKSLSLIIQLKPILERELQAKSCESLFYDIEMPLVGLLSEMELLGVKLDLKLLKNLSIELEKKLSALIKDIYKISGCEFNINSPKQLGAVLFEQLKLPVVKKTKTGFSTDEEVLKKLANKHKLPELLLEYRQLTKLKTTYIDALPELIDAKTGRIHTSFNQAATETGRLSSSNPNLQNIPVKTDIGSRIRQAIIASGKANCLVSCDYSQVELRLLAHFSKDKTLITAFERDADIHRVTASLINGVAEDEVSDQMREAAKRVNFGIVYGLTSYGLSKDLDIPVDEAQQFIDAYFLRYPGVKDYIDRQISLAQEKGFVTTILGRRRYLPEINSKNMALRQFAQRQAVNTPLQGSASDLIKLAMIGIDHELRNKKLFSRMVLQIHDELLFDLPRKELYDLVSLAREKMEKVLKLLVPIRINVKAGDNWLDMKDIK